ncbi:kelch domain-containing protein 10 homolog [Microplitis demolitor]|uniref:kelch domain-containing protein 10 homolog n=1 Tax=Microplitis demolitor TaxID=69319 RepID=UPI0004CD9768|nr:kelch domain-containing protein 10 homolog [Microplitis demolitor]XP_053598952.1 kelch domain-containing protein 10 homolog [Microplitis demolitor]XP_053598953.1 kelch domain-containing protein 10 homolog [Microplitis demolitor]
MSKNNKSIYKFKPFVFTQNDPASKEKPRARSGHRIVCDEKYLYSYGGYNPCIRDDDSELSNDEIWRESKPLFKELWRFNLTTRRWKLLPGRKSLPKELASTAVILRSNKLIIYGGTAEPFGESCNNRLYVCDLNDGSIIEPNVTGILPDPQYGQALICHDSYLYTIGGTTGYDYTCDIHRIDLRTGIWESVYICTGRNSIEPGGRYRHELAYDGKLIFVLGGGTSSECFGFTEIPAFDLEKNRWLRLQTFGDLNSNPWIPSARRCHGCVQYVDQATGDINAVISGGYTGPQVFNDVWRLNLRRLQWTCLKRFGTELPRPVYFHSAALTPAGQMYIFGGIVQNGSRGSRTQHVRSVWLVVPKLTEICWEAVNYYFKNLRNKSKDELANLGIPLKFIQRLDITN